MMLFLDRSPSAGWRHYPLWPVLLVLAVMSMPVLAEESETRWGVSALLGIHSPAISDLNNKEFNVPMPGSGNVLLPGEGQSTQHEFLIRNPLRPIDFGTETGIEFQLIVGPRDSFLMGVGGWEGASTSVVMTELPFQGELSRTAFERSANISYAQYYLGWKHNLFERSKKYKIDARFTLHELFDVDYRELMVFAFESGPAENFKRVVSIESQATGVFMMQLGMGIETYVQEWFSFGIDFGYTKSMEKFRLSNSTLKLDIQGDDNFNPVLPLSLDNAGQVLYLDERDTTWNTYIPLKLSFDGWRAALRFNFYF